MEVELREITGENFEECVGLSVADDQAGFVASNLKSIAQAKIFPTLNIRAVYADNAMVGFVMYGYDPDDERYYLGRLMIDAACQGKGFGKAATLKVVETLREVDDCDAVYLYYVPGNERAERLYSGLGFEKTGEVHEESGEVLMRYRFTAAESAASTI